MEHYSSWNGRLHQEDLEKLFGPITPHVLVHNDDVRVVHLENKQGENNQGTSRTYALTFFPKKRENGDIEAVDKDIRAGGAIGRTFREHGYEVGRNFLADITVKLPEWLKSKFDPQDEESLKKMLQSHPELRGIGIDELFTYGKGQISELYAKRGDSLVIYGDIVEILTPYISPVHPYNSSVLHPYDSSKFPPLIIDVTQINPSTEELEKEGFSRKETWRRIKQSNIWSDVQDRYERAKTNTIPTVNYLIGKTDEYLRTCY
jgi:hypothetical protein